MDYAAALIEQNGLLGALVADADDSVAVPTCPGWNLQQLTRHVGRGHRWAGQIVRDRMDKPLNPREVREGKPPADPDGALDWLHGSARDILDAVSQAGPDTPVWTFLGPKPASWWIRRRLHEETVHRADAAIALGVAFELDAELAADAISEWLDLVSAGVGKEDSDWDRAGHSVHLHATDGDLGSRGEWLIRGGSSGPTWENGHAKASVAIRGPVLDLMLALLRRRTVDELGLEVLGDAEVWSGWLARTPF
ncbi:MAG TPA: maleylpyruvate isomerase family mycothiol-dependent enzyme [Pseudonocardia sp.]|jgi:uncharacterized protein (TIGR03083 family)|nr:maleylpyruvate isomerase family mycothiol-dependent enzyme [Pseudonocardia sp.]